MELFKKYFLLLIVATLVFSTNIKAQVEFPEDKVSWEFSLEQDGCDAIIIAKITCVEHWHVYAANLPENSFLLPTEIEPDKSPKYEVIGKVIEPKPEFYHDDAADEDIYQHSNTFILKRKIKISSKKDFILKGRFSFQTCDESHCLPPFDANFSLKIKGCGEEETDELNFEFINGDEAKGKDGSDYVLVNGSWYKVPNGNSIKFYKKYLALGGSHNE
jgi:hypothetical protein